jgi:hypothetical protein
MSVPGRQWILAGDIGGTKTILGVFMGGEKRPRPKHIETYPSLDFPDLESIVERFLDRYRRVSAPVWFGSRDRRSMQSQSALRVSKPVWPGVSDGRGVKRSASSPGLHPMS